MKPRIVFFDLETRKHAKDLDPDDEEAGWELLRNGKGGASAIAIYDTSDNWLYLYDDHTIRLAAKHLEDADVIVGYNSTRFDVPCIEGILGRKMRLRNHIDIYTDIARTNAERGIVGQKGDFTLDRICKKNIGRGKINHGAHAKQLALQGRWGELFNYCADDVHLTRDLFYKQCQDGGLITINGKFMSISVPEWIRKSIVED